MPAISSPLLTEMFRVVICNQSNESAFSLSANNYLYIPLTLLPATSTLITTWSGPGCGTGTSWISVLMDGSGWTIASFMVAVTYLIRSSPYLTVSKEPLYICVYFAWTPQFSHQRLIACGRPSGGSIATSTVYYFVVILRRLPSRLQSENSAVRQIKDG